MVTGVFIAREALGVAGRLGLGPIQEGFLGIVVGRAEDSASICSVTLGGAASRTASIEGAAAFWNCEAIRFVTDGMLARSPAREEDGAAVADFPRVSNEVLISATLCRLLCIGRGYVAE